MAYQMFGAKPSYEPKLEYFKLEPLEEFSVKFYLKYNNFHTRKLVGKYRLQNSLTAYIHIPVIDMHYEIQAGAIILNIFNNHSHDYTRKATLVGWFFCVQISVSLWSGPLFR